MVIVMAGIMQHHGLPHDKTAKSRLKGCHDRCCALNRARAGVSCGNAEVVIRIAGV
jgi:hypothetical protein